MRTHHTIFITKKLLSFGLFIVVLLAFSISALAAPPANDNCATPQRINIANNGFALGTFNATDVDITEATIQAGESFAPALLVASLNQKSIWYKFTLPTTRSIRVTLGQPGINITAGDVGFAVFKAANCLPGTDSLSTKLTPIATFGNTFHPCVEPGEYLIQVSAKNAANGPVSMGLDVAIPSGSLYDQPASAYQFGNLGLGVRGLDINVDCLSLDDETETCPNLADATNYTKTAWFTFTTPAYFDYLSFLLASPTGNFTSNPKVFGYKLFKGDARSIPMASLVLADGCDTLTTNGYYPDWITYTCDELERSATYSIQLFFHKDFFNDVRIALSVGGFNATQAPLPVNTMPASNKLGVLAASANGVATVARDFLGCNSRLSTTACGPSLPATGLRIGTRNWNLSTFFTFTLATTSAMDIYAYPESPGDCGPNYHVRIFKQDVTGNCQDLDTANIVGRFDYRGIFDCMEPGTYTIQVMGADTLVPKTTYNYGYLTNRSNPICTYNSLGSRVFLRMTTSNRRASNRFDLGTAGAFDTINAVGGIMQPLVPGVTYDAKEDTLGCQNTVLPKDSTLCYGYGYNNSQYTKAAFREFKVADSGIIALVNKDNPITFKLYRGDAAALAMAQGVSSYPQTIEGLTPYSPCMDYYTYCAEDRVCVVPDTYSFLSLGTMANVGNRERPGFRLDTMRTKHRSPALAQDLGNILDTMAARGTNVIRSDDDYFTCIDNLETVPGYTPCPFGNVAPTKVIYRQFYLKEDALLTIRDPGTCQNNGYLTLFSGKVSEGGVAGLVPMGAPWNCFVTAVSAQCAPVKAGWYTIIAYGMGPTYEKPLNNAVGVNSVGSHLGFVNYFTIQAVAACPGPKFNKPSTASINNSTNLPHLIQWGPRVGHTAAYPKTDTTFVLPTENFNCTVDTPFTHVTSCANNMTKVAYWVFRLTQESYIQVNIGNLWGAIYDKDVRSQSLLTETPVQSCLQSNGHIQVCRMQPGTYTLVVFAPNSSGCQSVTPGIYIDQVGYSRFDHAFNAYDFGVVPPDKEWHSGKVGDVNPLNAGRAPSNDFFYCTTGAQSTDPTNSACYTQLTPSIYNTGTNNALYNTATKPANHEIAQRNIWYSFVINQPGWVNVKVTNKTLGKLHQLPFAIYRSDEDGNISFATLRSTGKVDSTVTQGLQHIGNNFTGYYCYATESIRFYRDPCNNKAERYYIVVTNRDPYMAGGIHEMQPNHQAEVSILLDSILYPPTKFDYYSKAGNIGDDLGVGTHVGPEDNFSCATVSPPDPVYGFATYAKKTLWYKFTTTVTGHVRFGAQRGSVWHYTYPYIQIFRQNTPGDSTSQGLTLLSQSSVYDNVERKYWGEVCVSPGATYYLILTGYQAVDEYTTPSIQIREDSGDFCSAPVVINMPGPGLGVGSALVDCHTIGTDYGEFGPNLTCPEMGKTTEYKSTWYRIDVAGSDTLDVTVYLDEKTNATSSDIKYRMMTGNCGAMQEQSCVQDALTRNTYECLVRGSYYIQVLTPVVKGNAAVTGTLDLHVEAVKHTGDCAPVTTCLVNANFIPQFDCTKDTAVRFVNYSTFGTDIKYKWDFGYNNATSTEVSPSFFYPALTTGQTYTIKLEATNTACGQTETATATITVPARPYVDLGPNRQLCTPGSNVVLDATSWPGATYVWQNNSTNPTFTASTAGNNRYNVTVTYNGCMMRDTVFVFVNNITKRPTQTTVLCVGQEATLNVNRSQGETYQWSTGEFTNQIVVSVPGPYWVDITLRGCTIRDSFLIESVVNSTPLGDDRAICFSPSAPYVLNATTTGATSYRWQNGAGGATFSVTAPGKYWVDIRVGTCLITDTVEISEAPPVDISLPATASYCQGDSVLLDAGAGYTNYLWSHGATTRTTWVKTDGSYLVTVNNSNGCTAISNLIAVSQRPNPQPDITGVLLSCNNVPTSLDAGAGFKTYSWSTGQNTPTISTAFLGKIIVTVTDSSNCMGKDSVVVQGNKTILRRDIDTTVCKNGVYTAPSGKTYSAAGMYMDTMRAISGCDSLITTINLQVSNPVSQILDTALCLNTHYTLPSGARVSTAGIYRDTVRNRAGCDSLITQLTLRASAPVLANIDTTVCANAVFIMPSGAVKNTPGLYTDTLRNRAGCDSLIITVRLQVITPVQVTIDTTLCSNGSYTMPGGTVLNTAGIYRDTVRNRADCDSLITQLTLRVSAPVLANIDTTVCANAVFIMPSGAVKNTPGLYTDTLRNRAGCDSLIITIRLQIATPVQVTIDTTICSNGSYTMPGGTVLNTAGIYKDTLQNRAGCDSLIVTVDLKVFPVILRNLNPAICLGSNYTLPSGRIITAAGIYQDTIRAAHGCDSLVTTVNLTIKQPTRKDTTVSICVGTSYRLPNGQTVNTPGLYTHTLTGSNGCDSVVNITLQIGLPLAISLRAQPGTICAGETATLTATATGGNAANYQYIWQPAAANSNAITVSPAATTSYTVTVSDGCTVPAASAQATITVNPQPSVQFTLDPKDGCVPHTVHFTPTTTPGTQYTWQFGDGGTSNLPNPSHTYLRAGVYTVSLEASTAEGCQASFSAVNGVVVNETPSAAFEIGPSPNPAFNRNMLFTNRSTGASQWLWDFGDGIGSSTQQNPAYSYLDTGSFTIRLIAANQYDCADTAVAVTVIRGIGAEVYIPNAFTPNKDGKNDVFRIFGANIRTAKTAIYNRWGEKVFEGDSYLGNWDGRHQKTGADCVSGAYVYAIAVVDKKGEEKMYKGTVMLVR